MKKFLLGFVLVFGLFALVACAGYDNAADEESVDEQKVAAEVQEIDLPSSRTLVAYFSQTGVTAGVAQTLADVMSADLFEIIPADPYTAEDVDYNADDSRAKQEQNDISARPAIEGSVQDMANYDVVFIGFPIWWGKEPSIIDTFVESYDFDGKTLVAFCTSSSSGISEADADLKALTGSDVHWLEGHRFEANADGATVQQWVDSLHLSN